MCCPESIVSRKVRSSSEDHELFPPVVPNPPGPSGNWNLHSAKKRNIGLQNLPKTSCVYPVVYAEPLIEEFNGNVNKYSFRMIYDCRENHMGSELHTKCLAFRNLSSLEINIPVVSRNSKAIYANRFCAECNDITTGNVVRDNQMVRDKG